MTSWLASRDCKALETSSKRWFLNCYHLLLDRLPASDRRRRLTRQGTEIDGS